MFYYAFYPSLFSVFSHFSLIRPYILCFPSQIENENKEPKLTIFSMVNPSGTLKEET